MNWTGGHAGTQVRVLTTDDPNAPTGSGFRHWAVFSIPTSATGLAQGVGNPGSTLHAVATQLNNGSGQRSFSGCGLVIPRTAACSRGAL
ncbi:hypothetical protein [Deinococcus soli (ex Cha et al. 2016)]|uniref:hypothetical protein n=1 Tax=Deinococcus soli (ex Cha et al. 2016) TaxID=1309411 RepID=UPI00166DD88E|nr:hypothetical protein [Deinococcus soli (ex Cha et al. 2016)]